MLWGSIMAFIQGEIYLKNGYIGAKFGARINIVYFTGIEVFEYHQEKVDNSKTQKNKWIGEENFSKSENYIKRERRYLSGWS